MVTLGRGGVRLGEGNLNSSEEEKAGKGKGKELKKGIEPAAKGNGLGRGKRKTPGGR